MGVGFMGLRLMRLGFMGYVVDDFLCVLLSTEGSGSLEFRVQGRYLATGGLRHFKKSWAFVAW